MVKDPIVEEVRRVRKEIETETQRDPERFFQRLKRIERQRRALLYRGKPRQVAMSLVG